MERRRKFNSGKTIMKNTQAGDRIEVTYKGTTFKMNPGSKPYALNRATGQIYLAPVKEVRKTFRKKIFGLIPYGPEIEDGPVIALILPEQEGIDYLPATSAWKAYKLFRHVWGNKIYIQVPKY